MIYLDYAASSPLHPELVDKLQEVYAYMGNPQSDQMTDIHQMIDTSKERICQYFNGDKNRLFFTSGATESISTAIVGASRFYQHSGKEIITFETEHQAVLSAYHALSKEGFKVHILPVLSDGRIDYDLLEKKISDQTILISINGLCNETGLVQDLEPLFVLKEQYGFMVHLDACQMIGKVRFDIQKMDVDFMSLSSHKCYGPQGIGALYIAKGRHIVPIIHGADPIRSGTMPVALMVLMGEVYSILDKNYDQYIEHMAMLRGKFLAGLDGIEYTLLSDGAKAILNIRFHGIDEQQIKLIREKIYCQVSSACKSGLSHVLQARLPYQDAKECIRFSLGIMTSEEEIEDAVQVIRDILA